jgi:hypothetical protein
MFSRELPYVDITLCNVNASSTCIWSTHLSVAPKFQRLCSHQELCDRALLFRRKLLSQWSLLVKLKSSLRTFYGRHHDCINHYEIPHISSHCDTLVYNDISDCFIHRFVEKKKPRKNRV